MGILQGKLLKTSKGVMLLELILSMALITVIISMLIPVFLKINNTYNHTIQYDRNYFYAQEAMLFIKNEMVQNTLSCDVENNKIIIKKLDGTKKEIYEETKNIGSSNVIMTYYNNGYSSTTNNILKNIKNFKFYKKSNVLYLFIVTTEGKKYERCWALNP